jgi:hypothetical protein
MHGYEECVTAFIKLQLQNRNYIPVLISGPFAAVENLKSERRLDYMWFL